MKGIEIKERLQGTQDTDRRFIKWWRVENDFADFELVEDFLRGAGPDQEFAGYELLNSEQMWELLQAQAGDHATIDHRRGEKVIVWRRAGSREAEVLPYTPESLMKVFDAETGGDTID